jgi:hypothetical protein
MKTKMKLMVAGMILAAGMATAAVNTDLLISDLQAQGYTWIEVKRGPTQIKIEAIKGSVKVETIIDAETGAVLKREVETASAAEQGRTGVELRDRDRDFIDVGQGGDDDSNDDSNDDSDDDNSDDSDDSDDDNSDDDSNDDDDDNGGHGGDDDEDDNDDDDNSGHGGGDDDDDDSDDDNEDDSDNSNDD